MSASAEAEGFDVLTVGDLLRVVLDHNLDLDTAILVTIRSDDGARVYTMGALSTPDKPTVVLSIVGKDGEAVCLSANLDIVPAGGFGEPLTKKVPRAR